MENTTNTTVEGCDVDKFIDVVESKQKLFNKQNEEFLDAYDDVLYDICESVERNIGLIDLEHPQQPERPQKRHIELESNNNTKKVKCEENCDLETCISDEMVKCKSCQIQVRKKYFATHSRSKLHKNNISKLHNTLKVSVESAFGKRVISYKMNDKVIDQSETPEVFLNSIKNEIMVLIQKCIETHNITKP
ncbi:uncharacterized protein LOC123689370 [Pieris rapae]|uniref:uncharacterized protein LOC123689370 n=1 Tax=Pieris rapae TaxID=64459 RepID=UPI001E27E8B2|nr:uncharacterized protein LOC123689370 [Pieris rapae]